MSGKIKAIRAEVYSRVVGYYRPVDAWNKGKQEEYKDRQPMSAKELEEASHGDTRG